MAFAQVAAGAGLPPRFTRAELVAAARPLAGRPIDAMLVFDLRAAGLYTAAVITVENGRPVATFEVGVFQSFDWDHHFAVNVELPPLPAGEHSLAVRTVDLKGRPVTSTEISFEVHAPLQVTLEPADSPHPGRWSLRVRGSADTASFTGPPRLAGGRLELPLAIGCDRGCGAPVVPFDLSSEPFELPAARQIDLVEDGAPYGRPRLLWSGSPEVALRTALVQGGRFEIEIELDRPETAIPRLVRPPSEDSALFYFFSEENWESMVKVLDGCAINGHFWVFAASSTDVGYTLRVSDLMAGRVREYRHAGGSPAPALTDIQGFACP